VPFDFEMIRARLADRIALRQDHPGIERRAAVAVVLRQRPPHAPNDTEVLLIRRAERLGDPWSGHMAFPGGHQNPDDLNLRVTAMRETMEEVGLDLSQHEYLGALDELNAFARGRPVGMSIAPHVFALRGELPPLQPNYEVAELVWGSLCQMALGEIDTTKELTYGNEARTLPAYDVHGHVVWGMTYYMLRSLFQALGSS